MGADYEYQTLDINKDGVDDYHINQYQILFCPRQGETVESVAKDFLDNFATYFNGDKKAGLATGERNVAAVHPNGENKGGKNVYEFMLDLKTPAWLTKFPVDLPDIHPDYVCEVMRYGGKLGSNQGFSFETLKRLDLKAKRIMDEGQKASGRTGGISRYIAELVIDENARHVLAGRRSWLVAKSDLIQRKDILFEAEKGACVPPASTEVFTIQTAAIERYSRQMTKIMGYLNNDRDLVDRIWSNQLVNFIKMKKYRFWSRSRKVFTDNTSNLKWNPIFGNPSAGVADAVFSRKTSYDSSKRTRMYKDEWIQGMVSLHPALKLQFSDWK